MAQMPRALKGGTRVAFTSQLDHSFGREVLGVIVDDGQVRRGPRGRLFRVVWTDSPVMVRRFTEFVAESELRTAEEAGVQKLLRFVQHMGNSSMRGAWDRWQRRVLRDRRASEAAVVLQAAVRGFLGACAGAGAAPLCSPEPRSPHVQHGSQPAVHWRHEAAAASDVGAGEADAGAGAA